MRALHEDVHNVGEETWPAARADNHVNNNDFATWGRPYTKMTGAQATRRRSADVVVIGAGLAGVSTAYYLTRRGVAPVVLEKDEVGAEQSSRAWGFVRQQERDPVELPLMMASNALWRDLQSELDADLEFTMRRQPGDRPAPATARSLSALAGGRRRARAGDEARVRGRGARAAARDPRGVVGRAADSERRSREPSQDHRGIRGCGTARRRLDRDRLREPVHRCSRGASARGAHGEGIPRHRARGLRRRRVVVPSAASGRDSPAAATGSRERRGDATDRQAGAGGVLDAGDRVPAAPRWGCRRGTFRPRRS